MNSNLGFKSYTKGIDADEKRRDAQSLIPPNFGEGD